MSLEAILQAITTAGEEQGSQTEEQTRAQVEEILAGARQEAARVKTKAFENAVEPAARERSRILHLAKLEVLHATGGLRETLVDTALEGAGGRLSGIRTQAAYRQVLYYLTSEALAEIKLSSVESQAACLEIDPRDRSIMGDHPGRAGAGFAGKGMFRLLGRPGSQQPGWSCSCDQHPGSQAEARHALSSSLFVGIVRG